MGKSSGSVHFLIGGIFLLFFFLSIWEWLVKYEYVSSLALPLPSKVLIKSIHLFVDISFIENWIRTISVWFYSLIIGLSAGLILGFLSGYNKKTLSFLLPFFSYFRSIPPIAMFPVALIALKPGALPIGFVASMGSCLYVFPGIVAATSVVCERYYELSRIIKIKRLYYIKYILLPATALQVLASSRIAATYAFAVCVAGEMIIGGRFGVGAAILTYTELYNLETAYAYILYTGLIGFLIDHIFQRISELKFVKVSQKI